MIFESGRETARRTSLPIAPSLIRFLCVGVALCCRLSSSVRYLPDSAESQDLPLNWRSADFHHTDTRALLGAQQKRLFSVRNSGFLEKSLCREPRSSRTSHGLFALLGVRIVFSPAGEEFFSGAAGSRVDLFAPGLFNHDIEVTGGVLREECADILGEFFRQKRKRAKGGEE